MNRKSKSIEKHQSRCLLWGADRRWAWNASFSKRMRKLEGFLGCALLCFSFFWYVHSSCFFFRFFLLLWYWYFLYNLFVLDVLVCFVCFFYICYVFFFFNKA